MILSTECILIDHEVFRIVESAIIHWPVGSIVLTWIVVYAAGRRELFVLHFHVPSKNFIDDQSGFVAVGIGVVSILGVGCAETAAPSVSEIVEATTRRSTNPKRIENASDDSEFGSKRAAYFERAVATIAAAIASL